MSWPCPNHAARRRMVFGLRDATQAEENTRQNLKERSAWAHVTSRPGEIKLATSSDRREIRWSRTWRKVHQCCRSSLTRSIAWVSDCDKQAGRTNTGRIEDFRCEGNRLLPYARRIACCTRGRAGLTRSRRRLRLHRQAIGPGARIPTEFVWIALKPPDRWRLPWSRRPH